MWSYYGAKTNVVHLYPPPKYGKIIEPFAGTARYALKYWDREVLLVDKYDVIIKIWKWLQQCSAKDVLALPRFKKGDHVDRFKFDCDEAKWLCGFLMNKGLESPRLTATSWVTVLRPNWFHYNYNRIANDLHKIKHWKIELGSFADIENQEASWFIDPPYEKGGHIYKQNNTSIDYGDLRKWCMERKGQVIVCESNGAQWMQFMALKRQKTRKGMQHEIFWTNEPTSYGVKQTDLFK